jgi:hypothetical protein
VQRLLRHHASDVPQPQAPQPLKGDSPGGEEQQRHFLDAKSLRLSVA